MSKDNQLVLADTAAVETLQNLAEIAKETVSEYAKTAPALRGLAESVLKILTDEATLNTLENSELIKLFEISQRQQLVPLEQLTKLFTQMNSLNEKLGLSQERQALQGVVKDIERAAREGKKTFTIEDITNNNAQFEELLIQEVEVAE